MTLLISGQIYIVIRAVAARTVDLDDQSGGVRRRSNFFTNSFILAPPAPSGQVVRGSGCVACTLAPWNLGSGRTWYRVSLSMAVVFPGSLQEMWMCLFCPYTTHLQLASLSSFLQDYRRKQPLLPGRRHLDGGN